MEAKLKERLAMAVRFLEDEIYQDMVCDDPDQKFSQNMKAILLLLSDLLQQDTVCVPLEPTNLMLIFGTKEIKKPFKLDVQRARECYKTMLEASKNE